MAYARVGGVLYLIIIILGGVDEIFIRAKLIVPGDAAATARNIQASATLFRLSIAGDLVMHICDIPGILIFYVLLKPVNKNLSLLAAMFNLVQTAILGLGKIYLLTTLSFSGGSDHLDVFTPYQLQSLAYLSLNQHESVYGIGLIFFGFTCLIVGYLMFKSGYFPRFIGVMQIIAGVAYLVNSFTQILSPGAAAALFPFILLPAFIGELSTCLWLLIKGINVTKWNVAYQKLLCFLLLLSVAGGAAAQNTVVSTRHGWIRGVDEHGVVVFRGVPYAEPPVGGLRYRAPVAKGDWSDTLDATKFGAVALQPGGKAVMGSEDCLTLNVYTPGTDHRKRAVVIWVHGGSMTGGSGKGMDGHAFADQDDIVTVTINYRLGALGFLYLGDLGPDLRQSGNLGLLDVIAALQWVHENIAAFGGAPERVTVMGESAGAKLLSAVMVAPASRGLYQQAILESGAVQCIRDSATAKRARALLLRELGLGPEDARKLTAMPADSLMLAQARVCAGIGGNSFFGPVYDGGTIVEDGYRSARQGKLSGIRVIVGTNEDEGAAFVGRKDMGDDPNRTIFQPLFRANAPMADAYYRSRLKTDSPYAALVRTLTQYMYQLHSYRFADALSGAGAPVYLYRYRYRDGQAFGARHGNELRYIWDASRILVSGDDPVKKQLARGLHGAWAAFIKTGYPNGDAVPEWPLYSAINPRVMVFDTTERVERIDKVYDDKAFPSAVFVIK